MPRCSNGVVHGVGSFFFCFSLQIYGQFMDLAWAGWSVMAGQSHGSFHFPVNGPLNFFLTCVLAYEALAQEIVNQTRWI